MILKVQTESGWLYFGDVKMIDLNKDVDAKDYGISGIADGDRYECVGLIPTPAKEKIKKILGTRDNGSRFVVRFDSPAYLLGNDGKTIERF